MGRGKSLQKKIRKCIGNGFLGGALFKSKTMQVYMLEMFERMIQTVDHGLKLLFFFSFLQYNG